MTQDTGLAPWLTEVTGIAARVAAHTPISAILLVKPERGTTAMYVLDGAATSTAMVGRLAQLLTARDDAAYVGLIAEATAATLPEDHHATAALQAGLITTDDLAAEDTRKVLVVAVQGRSLEPDFCVLGIDPGPLPRRVAPLAMDRDLRYSYWRALESVFYPFFTYATFMEPPLSLSPITARQAAAASAREAIKRAGLGAMLINEPRRGAHHQN